MHYSMRATLLKSTRYFLLAFFMLLFTACQTQPIATVPTTQFVANLSPQQANSFVTSWAAFNGGGQRNAVNNSETAITSQTVGRLALSWKSTLPAVVDGSPVFLANVATASGVRNLVFVTTKPGSLLAVDSSNGQIVWRKDVQGTNITTSSPAIDPNHQYIYSYGTDGKVHKYAVGSGAEVVNGTWPSTMTLMPQVEKGSSSLNVGNGYLYVTTSGYNGDFGHYEGHAIAINLTTGAKTVFNVLCSNIHQLLNNTPGSANYCAAIQAGVWGRAGVVVDPQDGYVYITSGNGAYDANTGGHNYGDSVIKLSADLSHAVDSYTPGNYPTLQANDLDLGSDAPTILPVQARSSSPYMVVQGGKDNTLRLLNRKNLGNLTHPAPNHVGGELQQVALPQGCDIDTQMTAWNDASNQTWVFVANDCGLSAFKVVTNAQGHSSLQLAYNNGNSGSSPFIANNILFVQGNGIIRAMSPTTGAVLWSSTQASAGGSVGALHWQSPLVVNGRLYAIDNAGNMFAYGIK